MPNISVHVDPDTKQQLEALAQSLDRSRSWVVGDALKPYLEYRQWMIAETTRALEEVKSGKAELVEHDVAVARILTFARSL